ncbi:MAG: FtsQ-type POTRA domain-containing protein [Verrucomicrobia bacterium]|nr:FtsQ-type POTRA domain-containing protein [Verrucomicrobiota bacterium]
MSQDLVNAPTARSWRDIPQPVKPRAMSRGGKWRLTTSVMRGTAAVTVLGLTAWGVWEVIRVLQEDPTTMPAAAKTVAVKNLELRTDGVLGNDWLARTLALPKHTSLTELDLQVMRTRLLASGQVNAAWLTKYFPDTLKVQVAERTPVVRVMAELRGRQVALLVARDGVVFEGHGYEAALLDSLPWLDGVKLTFNGERYEPVADMALVADLLSRAQVDAPHLYRTWNVVSLARLKSDAEVQVRTKPGTTVVFAANADFFQQIARLDYQWDLFGKEPVPPVKIDLSLGNEVLVAFQPAGLAQVPIAPAAVAKPAPAPTLNFFPNSQPKPKL